MEINTKEFAKLKGISVDKAKRMDPYIKGATQCPHCKQWSIPENARAIYIPDLRKYKKDSVLRPYYYILESIVSKTESIEAFTGISEQEKRIYIEELINGELIRPINSTNQQEYVLTLKDQNWFNSKNEAKREIANKVLSLAIEGVKTINLLLMIINNFNI